jgi:penicillin amidase
VDDLKATLGDDPDQWSWGDLHTLTLVNPSMGSSGRSFIDSIFNRGAYRISGGSAIVNATGWDASRENPYEVRSLPSMRMIVDLGELSNSLTIHTTGQSGHAYHEHYADMTDPWRTIQYHPMLWEQEMVAEGADSILRLSP